MPIAYINRDDLKTRLGRTETGDDAVLRTVIEAASREVDDKLGRRFQPYSATRYYTANDYDVVLVDDLLTVTTLKTLTMNSGGTRTYGNTWASADYDLLPYDAADDREPFTRIGRNPQGTYTFPTDRRGVEIVGVWGYWLDTIAATTATEAIDTSETAIDVTSGAAFKTLQTVLIDSEQLYITAISSNTITVERGVNGTTAATHDSGTTMYTYRYPEPIVEATALEAARLFRRKDAPLGVVGSPEFGTERIASSDPDWARLTRRYGRRVLVGV